MIKILLGTLMVGLVVGCAPEVAEEPSSSILVNPSSGVTIPEGLTVHDVDHNSDGTIDMDDLVIVGKFFGQNVPETGDLAMASDADNTDGYVYALMELPQFDTLESYLHVYLEKEYIQGKDEDYPEHWDKELINNELAYLSKSLDIYNKGDFHYLSSIRVRFAFRFLIKTIDGEPNIIEVKVKPVNEYGSEHNFVKKTITQSLDRDGIYSMSDTYLPKTTTDGGGREVHVKIHTTTFPRKGYDFRPIKIGKYKNSSREIIVGRVTITVLRTNQRIAVYTKDEDVAKSWPDQIDKSGITDWRIHLPSYGGQYIYHRYRRTHYYLADAPSFGIRYLDTDRCELFHRRNSRCYASTYMTSDEVKAEYFPEDE